ncbi:phage tail protein [Wenyingzhuangia marina]|uniref:Conserved hypothetical phage tail region protein n=1 Tax=Wenyingzhuangia marina TaxID=1195760 RepID=A0A1M5VGD5_9FLAO|nr:phage tail protein [Wenyingzhuangia marina]GGF72398.1 hypothetical protein GCM10011397_14110 [Wenyingzhuangia marina]SHH74164.1 conserved hypothetical phage tail region protein [Wenyingzhuangia marina]
MADDGSKEGSNWPMPKFRFKVDLGIELKKISFQEVSGMDVESQIIEYRKSNSKLFSTIKTPGIVKNGNVVMKRGVFLNNNAFWDFHSQIAMNTIERRTIIIQLLNENNEVTIQWQLNNAWPTKITSTNLESDENEVAVDILEIAHEELIITNG